jgi:hypothetical protein
MLQTDEPGMVFGGEHNQEINIHFQGRFFGSGQLNAQIADKGVMEMAQFGD